MNENAPVHLTIHFGKQNYFSKEYLQNQKINNFYFEYISINLFSQRKNNGKQSRFIMKSKENKAMIATLAKQRKEITSSKEAAKALLIQLGIYKLLLPKESNKLDHAFYEQINNEKQIS